jgi:hypothetical protein
MNKHHSDYRLVPFPKNRRAYRDVLREMQRKLTIPVLLEVDVTSLTISFDDDIIDSAPAARFTGRLKDLIERVFGLLDQEAASALHESKQEPVAQVAPQ